MTFVDHILSFNQSLQLNSSRLPSGIEAMNPFGEPSAKRLTALFYRKYFSDERKRYMVVGINPGRFGGGVTGIPFTDPHKLSKRCGIAVDKLSAPELSSDFIYTMIDAFGGPDKFYASFFLTALSPLGFVQKKNGKETNYNYYDSKELQAAVTPFILQTFQQQLNFGIHRDVCFCLGTGKNFAYLSKLNEQHRFFQSIVPLDHPRFIMQYRRKKMNDYVDKYLQAFAKVEHNR